MSGPFSQGGTNDRGSVLSSYAAHERRRPIFNRLRSVRGRGNHGFDLPNQNGPTVFHRHARDQHGGKPEQHHMEPKIRRGESVSLFRFPGFTIRPLCLEIPSLAHRSPPKRGNLRHGSKRRGQFIELYGPRDRLLHGFIKCRATNTTPAAPQSPA